MELTRPPRLCHDAVVIDGIGGCGKTMLSAVVASLARVELLRYSYEIEQFCIMRYFGLLDSNSAAEMVRYQLDYALYNVMMGRDVNFRFSDLSSVFKSPRRREYFSRILAPGDEVIPARIASQRPILHLATHDISGFAKPLMDGGPQGLLFINMHRHPLFMLKQNIWNMENLINHPRHFAVYYKWNDTGVPFYFKGREELMARSTAKEMAIFYVEWVWRRFVENQGDLDPARFYQLTFESFVADPHSHIAAICARLGTAPTAATARVLKRERIPRVLLSDGRARDIYRRVGWKKSGSKTREAEMEELRSWAYDGISEEAKSSLDWLRSDYDDLTRRLNASSRQADHPR